MVDCYPTSLSCVRAWQNGTYTNQMRGACYLLLDLDVAGGLHAPLHPSTPLFCLVTQEHSG
eukprot:COSAG01_NODE_62504_length_284_cov_0.837838_1_plen_60_part_01